MGKMSSEDYEAWDLSPVSLPVRSMLYALEPIGVGTACVESLTSYIARLADAHCVFPGILMEKLLISLMPGYLSTRKLHPLYRSDGNKSNLLNATGPRASYAVQALETVTLRTDLQYLTLLVLGEIVYIRGLIRLTKAWCPVCYQEWHLSGRTVYDPLLWVLQEISMCTRHQRLLQTHCPYQGCQRAQPALAWRSQPGYCTYCQRWLGQSLELTQVEDLPGHETDAGWQQWLTDAWGAVFATLPTISSVPRRQQVSEVLTHAVESISKGNITAFARLLGLGEAQLGQWIRNRKIPQADMLFRLCQALGLSLCEMFFGTPEALHPYVKQQIFLRRSWIRPPGIEVNRESLYQLLEDVLARNEQPPPSLAEVARQLGHEPSFLYQCAPTLSHEISARFQIHRHQRKEARMQRYREEIWTIARQLQAQGLSLTSPRLQQHLVHPGILRDRKVREMLQEIRQELGENR